MRSARTGKCFNHRFHARGGGGTPRPRSAAPTPPHAPLPAPAQVSERLLARQRFAPSPQHNLLAAAWPMFYRRICASPHHPRPCAWWVGPALLQTLFALEHNVLYRQLARACPALDNNALHREARHIGLALIDNIQMQWRASHLAPRYPALARLWRDIAARRHRLAPGAGDDPLLTCIAPQLPDRFEVLSVVTGTRLGPPGGFGFLALHDPNARAFIERYGAANLWYSIGAGSAGAFQPNNFPLALRRLPGPAGFSDLAAASLLRQRQGPRASFAALRRTLGLSSLHEFEQLDPRWARAVAQCYSHIATLDAWVGMLAEPRDDGCAVGETALRCLALLDRPAPGGGPLSAFGRRWVRNNSLASLLLRHYPVLQDALYRVENPFRHWRPVSLIAVYPRPASS